VLPEDSHSNGYLYSYIRYPTPVTWILGVSVDALDDGILGEFHQVNPKLGVIWNVTPYTVLRFAAFRALKRSLLTNQTIEPTQVAGFNQFFDDFAANESRQYGIALDHQFSADLYGGIEVSTRDLERPILGGIPPIDDLEEELYRAYLHWTPHPHLAASLDYQLERFENEDNIIPPNTRTHQATGALRYFHPSGFFGGVKVTYINQAVGFGTVDFIDDSFVITRNVRSDQFALVDAAVGYRLPKRYGILSLAVRNLTNEDFNYQGLEFRTVSQEEERPEGRPPFLPERTFSVQFTTTFSLKGELSWRKIAVSAYDGVRFQ